MCVTQDDNAFNIRNLKQIPRLPKPYDLNEQTITPILPRKQYARKEKSIRFGFLTPLHSIAFGCKSGILLVVMRMS